MKDDLRTEPVLRLEGVERRYGDLVVLMASDFALRRGETAALLGPSGSGKSSLLHIAGLLERPSAGEVFIDGVATSSLSDAVRTRLRRDTLGFVYQFHHLLPEFSALGNVALPQLIAGRSKRIAEEGCADPQRPRTRRASTPSAGPAVWRGAATHRDCARARQQAENSAG